MGWIEKYLVYTEKQVSPRIYHFWSAVAVLGGAMERRVYLRVGERRFIYPGQILVVLVGASAALKKTTAAELAVDFLLALKPWQCYVLPRKLSPQQLLAGLQRLEGEEGAKKEPLVDANGRRVHSAGFIFAGELGAMFTTEPFAETLATQINILNDCPKGEYPVEFRSWKATLWKPCVGGIGCITPKGLARELPKTARTAGFFGRLVVVFASYTDRAVALLEEPSPQAPRLFRELLAELGTIADLRGKFTFTPQAVKWQIDWYHTVYKPMLDKMDLPETEQTGYINRKESHMLRVAMILAVAETGKLEGDIRHLERALKELEVVEQGLPHAFAQMHTNPYSDFDTNLTAALERIGPKGEWVPEQKLRKAVMHQGGDRRFIEARDTLTRTGDVEVRGRGDDREWRRVFSSGRLLRGAAEERKKGGSE